MSLLTRCPACTTLYRVVPDQLRISEGWVKCGQCAEIFDASQNLIQVALASDEPVPDPIDDASGPPAQNRPATAPGPAVVSVPDVKLDHDPDPDAAPLIAPDQDRKTGEAVPIEPSDDPSGAVAGQAETAQAAQFENGLEHVSFLTPARPPSLMHTRLKRAFLALVSAVLGLALFAQWVYQERDHLAALRPDWRPGLQSFCAPLNCSVSALQRMDAMVIESAALHQLGADAYRLDFAIRNQADLAVALPSIELSLTDVQEQIVIRRVLSPAELLTSLEVLAPGSEWPVTVAFQIRPDAAMPRIAGYRLLVFYP